jgi:hypothetical protein
MLKTPTVLMPMGPVPAAVADQQGAGRHPA